MSLVATVVRDAGKHGVWGAEAVALLPDLADGGAVLGAAHRNVVGASWWP